VLFLLAGGVWADRLPRQLVMIGADALRAAVQALVAASLFLHTIRIWQFAAAAALLGLGSSFFNPASTGLVPSIVSPTRLQEANALLGLSRSAVQVAGPALSGLLIATLGFGTVFAIDAASFVASLVCLTAMRLPTRTTTERPRQSTLVEALEGLRAVRERRWIVAALSADLVFNFCFAAYFVLGPIVVERHFDGARDWGLIMTAASIGSVAGGAAVLRFKPRRPLRIAYLFSFVMPLQLLALAPPLPLAALLIGSAAVFGNVTVMNTYWVTMEQQHVPRHLISRVDSLSWIASLLVMPLGLTLVGPLAAAVGTHATLIAAALLAAASSVAVLAVRDIRELERLDETPAEPQALPASAAAPRS
jgi:MFS family permease